MADSKDFVVPRSLIEKITQLLTGLLSEMPLSGEGHSLSLTAQNSGRTSACPSTAITGREQKARKACGSHSGFRG